MKRGDYVQIFKTVVTFCNSEVSFLFESTVRDSKDKLDKQVKEQADGQMPVADSRETNTALD